MSIICKPILLVVHIMFVYLHFMEVNEIVTKKKWMEKFVYLLEVDRAIIEFRIRLNTFCLLMNKNIPKTIHFH